MSDPRFPKNFAWGVGSAAYQIEGGAAEGGRTPTIWDTFSHTPGNTFGGHTGDVAADHYHRYAEDIALMAEAGIRHYRFGIGWTRILPQGQGKVNPEGLRFYDAIVDLCLEKGITPYITLYHWDLPQSLEDAGGWRSRSTAEAFCELAAVVARHFRGRVRHYYTLNEPQCIMALGYGNGLHAPGKRLPREDLFWIMHHLALAHGLAAAALRAIDPALQIGVASTGRLCYPQPDNPENLAAARAATFALSDEDWQFVHHWFLDAVVLGRYPEAPGCFLQQMAAQAPAEDWPLIHQRPDFIGVNVYNGHAVAAGEDGAPVYVPKTPGFARTALKWPVTPQVMRHGILALYERYGLPMVISENGQSCNDRVFLDGRVHDPDRIDFLRRYLAELAGAIEGGADVRGYFHWCFTDNYEWHSGYDDRFGLVYVDYPSQKRIPKDSYHWYAGFIREQEA